MSTATINRPTRTTQLSPLRLTRRGRLVVLLALVAVLVGLLSIGRGSTSQAGAGDEPVVPVGVTTVQAGETLWGLARRIAPDHDAREVVAQIRELNAMGDATLQAGQQLLLPVAT